MSFDWLIHFFNWIKKNGLLVIPSDEVHTSRPLFQHFWTCLWHNDTLCCVGIVFCFIHSLFLKKEESIFFHDFHPSRPAATAESPVFPLVPDSPFISCLWGTPYILYLHPYDCAGSHVPFQSALRHSDALLSGRALVLYSAPPGPNYVFLCVCVCVHSLLLRPKFATFFS